MVKRQWQVIFKWLSSFSFGNKHIKATKNCETNHDSEIEGIVKINYFKIVM